MLKSKQLKRKLAGTLWLILSLFTLLANTAYALPLDPSGDPDTSFSGDGKTSVNFASVTSFSEARGVGIQSTGKIVVGGSSVEGGEITHFALVRLNTNGLQDNSFGNGGSLKLTIGSYDLINDIAIYPADSNPSTLNDDKIVAVGFSNMPSTDNDFSIARFTPDGVIDTTFGGGDGFVTVDFGGASNPLDRANSVAIQDDGKIVVAGYRRDSSANGRGDDVALVRLNVDGTLDTSFGSGGKVITPVAADKGKDVASGVVIIGTGANRKILIGGSTKNEQKYTTTPLQLLTTIDPKLLLVRYTNSGALDTTFDGDGIRINDINGGANPGCPAPSISIIDLGGGVTVVNPADYGCGEDLRDIALQPDGKIVATGDYVNWGTFPSTQANTKTNMLTARFNADDGSFDTSFNSTGYVITSTTRGFYTDFGASIAVQADGRIVSFGWTDHSDDVPAYCDSTCLANFHYNHDFLFARFNTNGTYDTTFGGGDGIATIDLTDDGKTYDNGDAMTLDSSGKIIGVGLRTYQDKTNQASYIGVTRLNTDGSLDHTFGPDLRPADSIPDGFFYTQLLGGSRDEVGGMAVQSDGKVVLAGFTDNGSNFDFGLVRHNTDGSLDTTFGGGDGIATAGITGQQDTAAAVAIQSDGKIVVAGSSYGTGTQTFTVMRFTSAGALDTSFSGDGIATTTFGTNGNTAYAVAIQTDGKILVGGSVSDSPGNWDFGLARFSTDGSLDTSFDTDGKVRVDIGTGQNFDEIRAIALQTDGKIVVGGRSSSSSNSQFTVARFNTNGSADTSFNGNGRVLTRLTDQSLSYAGDELRDILILPDGKIVAAGKAQTPVLYNGTTQGFNAFALARFNSNGTLDTSLNGTGKKLVQFSSDEMDEIHGIARQFDDKIVAVGYVGYDFGLARFNWDDGSLDTTFGTNGWVTTDFSGFDRAEDAFVFTSGASIGKIIVGGTQGGNDFAAARYLGDPAPTTPGTPDLAAASDSGRSNTDNITNDNTPTFTGTCVTGETVVLKVGSADTSPVSKARCINSTYSVTAAAPITDGVKSISVVAVNGAGTSSASAALSVTIDTVALAPIVTSPTEGSTVSPSPTISGGGAEPTADITLKEGANLIGTTTASTDNPAAWSYASNIGICSHTIAVAQTDIAGNTSPAANRTFTVHGPTTTSISSNANPSVFGQPVSFTAQVSSTYGTPDGSVQFVIDGGNPVSVNLTNGQATLSRSDLPVSNTHTVAVSYPGSSCYAASSPAYAIAQVVNKADTTTLLNPSANPSVYGQQVIFTAAVSAVAPGAGLPTGSVTFKEGSNTLGTGSLNSAGQATFTTSNLSVGSHTITAEYGGDGNFNISTSSGLNQGVNRADTTITITADTPDPSDPGQAVSVTYSVAAVAPGAGTPTGNITVSDGTTSCTGTVAAGSCNLTFNTGGVKSLTAIYEGDTNFVGSTSGAQQHTVNKYSTTTTITSNNPNPAVIGQAVTIAYSVDVVAPGTGTPTGNVTVGDGGSNTCTATVAAGSCTITFSAAGNYTLTAAYGGDTNFKSSSATGVGQTVNKISTTSSITKITPEPSIEGDLVTVSYSVAVVAPGTGTPSGNVTVSDGAGHSCTATVTAGSCTLTFTTQGSYNLSATYGETSTFSGSTSSSVEHSVIPPNRPPTANASGPYTVNEGASLTLNAAASSDPDGDTLTYSWDVNGDGTFGDATTVGPTLTWPQLEALGINDGPRTINNVTVKVSDGKAPPVTSAITTLTIGNVIPTATFSNSSGTINEGSSASLAFSNQSDPSSADRSAGFKYSYDCTNDGVFEVIDSTTSASYLCTYSDNGTYTAKGRIKDKDGDYSDYTASVTVNNVAPTATVSGPASGTLNQVLSFNLGATDPSSNDQAAGFAFSINWGDGITNTVARSAGNGTGVNMTHAYVHIGSYSIQVTATDKDGSTSATAVQTVYLTGSEQISNPGDSTKTALVVGGTGSNDTIQVKPVTGGVQVVINGTPQSGTFAPTGYIIVMGQVGNDTITIDPSISTPCIVFGGDGDDTLTAGNGEGIFVGGNGNDKITGGNGRDIQIGGAGQDTLDASNGDDLLIAGTTSYDNPTTANLQALSAIQKEWSSTKSTYQDRINHLTGTTSGGLNGTSYLQAAGVNRTVFDDSDTDNLKGGKGQDWLLLNLTATTGHPQDTSDKEKTEVATDIQP